MNTPQQITLCTDELQQVLEPLIRRIIREELFKVIQQTSNIFFLSPDMPLYKDMEEIAQRKASHDIELLPHNEVWKQYNL
ncbi:MAG: hypothetical protein JRE64_01455 [Deltaproteobacteria bacterium]|nr:hypothetical protein [Deltaproteobacteria bacterium]